MKRIILLTLCLIFSTSLAFSGQWDKDIPLDGDAKVDFPTDNQAVLDSVDRVMSNYKRGMRLDFVSTSSITVSPGEVVVSNAAGSVRLFMNNTSSTTVTSSNIDGGGAFSTSSTYNVFAIAALATSETATFEIATSSTPSGATYYAKIGSFYVNGSGNIERDKVYGTAYQSVTVDADSKAPIQVIYSYGESFSSYSSKTGGIKIAYGSTGTAIGGGVSQAITNLPFTSASTYTVAISSLTGALNVQPSIVKNSGSQFTWTNNHVDAIGGNGNGYWVAIGY